MTVDMNIKELLVIGDSDLLIHQVQGECTTKNVKILPYLHCVKEFSYRQQMNGAVEAANKNITRILRKIVDNHMQWHEKLSFALLGYHTTMRTSTGVTPYMWVYGTKAMIPTVVEIPYLRVIQKAKLDNVEWIRVRQEQVMLIDEKRMDAVWHGQLYQNRMANVFNRKVKPWQFASGQLVLKKIFPHQEEAKGKFAPNWKGPYVIHRVLSGGALIFAEMDNRVNTKPIKLDAIKRKYI
ncbi:uncharacterized protein [Nicotiana tomentosiformis]|uniref:uncharacterized protein n=1 Tax=Nicotiana tomentosiformis TaxID=4098 RepID=UPI00051B9626|nr:uncharacterized protein LOC104092844 [Nicotiana tomentosiformis]